MSLFSKEKERTMKKKVSVLALSFILVAGSAWASGFRIPEQSVDSVAKPCHGWRYHRMEI
jgi:long-chain fatty acid transport protein